MTRTKMLVFALQEIWKLVKWAISRRKQRMTNDACSKVVQDLIAKECDELKDLLIEKNRAYGNSALDPMRVFSKSNPIEQLLVRLDDKLSRISRGNAAGEDVEKDLLGYLILLRIAKKMELNTKSFGAAVVQFLPRTTDDRS